MSKITKILLFTFIIGFLITAGSCPQTVNPADDRDGDGVSDSEDVCDGHDDSIDTDGDSFPDGCDECEGYDDFIDTDGDGVPDGCDECEGYDDDMDTDGDGVPDGCDEVDTDGDGVSDNEDICEGFDDNIDTDGDLVPDGCDNCEGHDDDIDTDGDGVPDGCDICEGYNDGFDTDGDGVPDGCDPPEITGVCDGVTHGAGESYISICVTSIGGETVKFTLTGNGLSQSTEPSVDSDGKACVQGTINTYGTYSWTAVVYSLGGLTETTVVGTIIVDSNNQSCTDTGPTDTDN